MTESFYLIAPRAKPTSAYGGLLQMKLFSDESPHELVRLLAIPVLPTAPLLGDGTQAGSGEPRPSQPQQLQTGSKIPGKRVADGEPHVVFAHREPEDKRIKLTGADNKADICSVSFSSLPVEIHRLIFTQCESIEDVACLGLTSQYFWAIGREYVRRYFASFLGPWAGKNIVFVEADVKVADLPPEFFPLEEGGLQQFQELLDQLEWRSNAPDAYFHGHDFSYRTGEHTFQHTLYNFGSTDVSYNNERIKRSSETRCICFIHRGRGEMKETVLRFDARWLLVRDSDYFPEDQPWIIRNLTTKELVRSEAIAIKPEFVHAPHIDVLGFGHVVMSRICWSKSPSSRIVGKTSLFRGVWAGHRFDLTTLKRHEEETNRDAGWTDVSQEVADEVANIWESELVDRWREILIARRDLGLTWG